MDKQKLVEISRYFISNKETVAVAESVTGGMLQNIFASMENAEKFFQGGITTYNIGQKAKHLDVEPVHALEHNCVSPKIACEMAVGACNMFQSKWGLGITGYATPVKESGNKIFAYYAVIKDGQLVTTNKLLPEAATPEKVKKFYTESILTALYKSIRK